jgi:hypothetical protein
MTWPWSSKRLPARKIKTPAQLLQVVMGYCGIDHVLRDTAGDFTFLPDGDIAMMDRGYNQVLMWIETADRGAGLIARDNPHGLPLYAAEGPVIAVAPPIRDAAAAGTALCVPVQVRDPKKQADLEGHWRGRRLPPAQAADSAQVERWLERILTANRPDELFE